MAKTTQFISLSLFILISSCERSGDEIAEETVSWPEIADFDNLAFQADGLVRVKDIDAARDLHADLVKTGMAVTPSSIPANAANPKEVELILSDLSNLVNGLQADTLDDATLENLILGLHPVIAKLINAAGMPHIHANEGPNSGFLFPIFDSKREQTGTVEIKLHDDAGDLEVWLKSGGYEGDPWRLPTDTTLTLNFPALNKSVTLAVRDQDRNEDESGSSTIVEGNTNYFVFPGSTDEDASWLMGADFAAKVELRFKEATTGSFVLRPHIHREKSE